MKSCWPIRFEKRKHTSTNFIERACIHHVRNDEVNIWRRFSYFALLTPKALTLELWISNDTQLIFHESNKRAFSHIWLKKKTNNEKERGESNVFMKMGNWKSFMRAKMLDSLASFNGQTWDDEEDTDDDENEKDNIQLESSWRAFPNTNNKFEYA